MPEPHEDRTTIDHAAEARKRIDEAHAGLASGDRGSRKAATLDYLEANAHATLALVNEQRIANVLAYLDHAEGDEYERLHDDIKKGLGI